MLLKPIEAAGLRVAGRSGDDQLVEIIEIPNHPWLALNDCVRTVQLANLAARR
jgi:CTP synthase (UTP-ammonia lyase)